MQQIDPLVRKQIFDEEERILWEVDVEPPDSCNFRFLLFTDHYGKMVGIGHDEMAGKTLEEALPPADVIGIQERYSRCVSERKSIQYSEYLYVGSQWRWWRTTLTPKFNAERQVYRLLGVSEEIVSLEAELRDALKAGELAVYGQPIIALDSGHTEGYEALIRWPGSDYAPNDFLPVAKVAGIMPEITSFVLNTVAKLLSEATDNTKWVAINISNCLDQAEFRQVIEQYNISPWSLRFEVTEDTQITDEVVQQYEQIIELGHIFELDDFGTERSTPELLRKIPFKAIKIDAQFVTEAWMTPNKAAVLTAAAALSQRFKPPLKVIAEGIETNRDLLFCEKLGFAYGQGYFWSRPVPLENLLKDTK